MGFWKNLFSGEGFPARWHCGRWSDELGWLHISSDFMIFLAYLMIPILMLYALQLKIRSGLPEPLARIAGLFVAFILCCGITHLNDAVIFFHPFYRFAGVMKGITAVVSWMTVFALIPALPKLLALHTPTELQTEVDHATGALKVERDSAERELEARRRVEAALMDAEARYRDLYDNAPDILLTIDLDSYQVTQCNATAQRRLGYLPEELVGQSMQQLCHDDSWIVLKNALKSLKADGAIEDTELVLRTNEGDALDISLNASLIQDKAANTSQARTALRDITNKKKAFRLFELAVEASPSGMLAVDLDGKIVLANTEAERLFGYAKNELIARRIEDLVPDDVRSEHPHLRETYLKRPMTRKMVGTRPLLGKKKTGETFPIEVGLNPIETPSGTVVLSAVIDRTEVVEQRRKLEAQQKALEKTNVELESFASAASHDLKAPLRAIQNAASWIEEDLPAEFRQGEVGENLKLLRNRAERMEALLNALLDYARAGRESTNHESVACLDVVLDIVALLGPEAEAATRVEGELPELVTARAPLQQVLYNLIANGLKHAERSDPEIVVSCTKHGDTYEFSVTDNGPGISAEFHAKIFEVFRTLHSRDVREGAGMGLALVKKVVESRGGQVRLRSQLGQGAIFTFSWPL